MNGFMDNGKLKRKSSDPNDPNKFRPSFSNEAGSNWFDTKSNLLYLLLKGDAEVIIKTQNVIQVGLLLIKI